MRVLGWVATVLAFILLKEQSKDKPSVLEPERILLIGDSLGLGLTAPLRLRAQQAQIPFDVLCKQSTRIDQWAGSPDLSKALARFRPTLVMVSLGTNDEFMGPGVVESQRAALRRLMQQLLQQPGVQNVGWIAPPSLPRQTNGIRAMLEEELGPQLFHSERLDIPRQPDKLHPTPQGYVLWADEIWRGM